MIADVAVVAAAATWRIWANQRSTAAAIPLAISDRQHALQPKATARCHIPSRRRRNPKIPKIPEISGSIPGQLLARFSRIQGNGYVGQSRASTWPTRRQTQMLSWRRSQRRTLPCHRSTIAGVSISLTVVGLVETVEGGGGGGEGVELWGG